MLVWTFWVNNIFDSLGHPTSWHQTFLHLDRLPIHIDIATQRRCQQCPRVSVVKTPDKILICIIKTDLVVEKTTENVFASYTKDKEKSKECRVCSHGRCAYIYVYIYMRIYTYVLVISVRICKITTHPTNSYIQKIEFCIPSLISWVIVMICWLFYDF